MILQASLSAWPWLQGIADGMVALLVALGAGFMVVAVAMQVLLGCSNVWHLVMCGSKFLLAVGLQVAAVAVVAKHYAGPVWALSLVNLSAAVVKLTARRQNVCQFEILSVVGSNCCQGAIPSVWARLASGCEDDSILFFDERALFQPFFFVVLSLLLVSMAMFSSFSLCVSGSIFCRRCL